MTEDEAKTRLCPMTLGRTPPNPEPCIVGACMGWRRTSEPVPGRVVVGVDGGGAGGITVSAATAAANGWPVLRDLSVAHGYCALAGRPPQ